MPTPPEPPPLPREDDDGLFEIDDAIDASSEEEDRLLDPDAWPDDDEDPSTAALLEPPATLASTAPELWQDDDEAEDELLPLEDLLDTQHDPDYRVESLAEEALPILPLAFDLEIEGHRLPAQVDLALATSRWVDPDASEHETRSVTLRIRGRDVPATLSVEPGEGPLVMLGRDVLHARFLLRP